VLEFLIDNVIVELGWHIVQQIIGLTVATNYANLLVELFLYSYEVKFNLTLRYPDDYLSLIIQTLLPGFH